ncbi:venom metalloproteinase antarease-like TtrivMP_A [Ixodes scapularis]|uniref:venom metalloproteinase antarease-like TtrivMP_A n=1 Tax=Ixodes scapularis TaxID=6945 RepID=UPI001C380614|nr:venom metalloproteinase antarease-like TtrivMP_A [Ixodes scapularis]
MTTILRILGFAVVAQWSSAFAEKGALVYPRLLESRGLNGERILKINEDITLNLERTSVFPEKLVIRTHEDGSLVNNYVDGSEHNKHLYHDTKQMAAVILKDEDGVNVEGLLRHDLRIQPMPDLERSLEGHVAHMLFPVKQRTPYSGDHGHPPDELNNVPQDNSTYKVFAEQRDSGTIFPEVHVVLDATTCAAYNYDKKEIINYLSVMATAANLRYKSVTNPSVKLTIVAVTLLRENAQPFLKFYKQSRDMVTFQDTLTEFYTYYQKDPEFNNADIYFLLTGLDIVGVATDGTLMRQFSGYAYLSKVCTVFKVGMSEDEPRSYDGVHLFSHEIAHLLGCAHDEDPPDGTMPGHPGSQKCPWDDGYIMSYVINFKNHFKFSPCCVESIRFVAKERDCLYKLNAKNPVKNLISLPGFRISPTSFCQFMHPLYRGVHSDKKAGLSDCVQTCRTAKNRRGGYHSWTHAALDGVPCDKRDPKKACINGKCTLLKSMPERTYRE